MQETTESAAGRIAVAARREDRGPDEWIVIRRARTHNLKDIDAELPRDSLVVITGVSGSGKSSLAFDTLYAEGQRRYIESLSSYARQFLEQMPRPDCDQILGLPPTIAIEQHTAIGGRRSTVATTTEIYDFLRLLYARAGAPHCPRCGVRIRHQTLEQIVAAVQELVPGTRATLMAPVVRGRKGHYRELLERIRSDGYVRARIDGEIRDLDEVERLERYKTHDIDVVVDRIVIRRATSMRLGDSLRMALAAGEGTCIVLPEGAEEVIFSQHYACPRCGVGFEEPNPKMFSFNSSYGACAHCAGLGTVEAFDEQLVVSDRHLSLSQGAVAAWQGWGGRTGRRFDRLLRDLAAALDIPWDRPLRKVGKRKLRALLRGQGLEGVGGFRSGDAVIPSLQKLWDATRSESTRGKLRQYMSDVPCPACGGARLRPEALAVTVNGLSIADMVAMSVSDCRELFGSLSFKGARAQIAAPVLKEIRQRLGFMMDVGLHYLTLDRHTRTLSRGEAQRIRLARQIGSGLTGVCYVLDEPSIGLHFRDNERLLQSLEKLSAQANTVLVVEHDEATIRRSDWILDLGPGAGRQGGRVVYNGPAAGIEDETASLTGLYLTGRKEIRTPGRRREATLSRAITLRGAREHNLKNITVSFPLGVLCCVTGVSGSGKSSLVQDVLYRALARKLYKSRARPGAHDSVNGAQKIDRVLEIDQAPIGKSPRSTPATYSKVMDHVRQTYAQTRQARVRGYTRSRFSYNTKGGRCEACKGTGEKTIEMSFLPDIAVTCQECHGRRYNQETLQVTVQGKSIADVLEMTVEEALEMFRNMPPIARRLRTLRDVGLEYVTLGQPSPTLSGGEAQRIKLARELGKVSTGRTLYILDEPTTGLHFDDVGKLLKTLHGLVDMGNTVIVIEHNLEIIKNADYLIDLGPEGGQEGGYILVAGTPEEVAEHESSDTGRALRWIFSDTRRTLKRV